MLNKLSVILISCYLFQPELLAQDSLQYRSIDNYAFTPGEKLKYSAYYGFITAGEAVLELKTDPVIVSGRSCHHAVLTGRTVGMLDWVYHVRDTYESYIDIEAVAPIKSIRQIKEGKYRYYNEVVYDHLNGKIQSQRSGEKSIPKYIQDIISVFYYARCELFNNLNYGDTISLQTYFTDEIFPVYAKYLGKTTIKTGLGKFRCLKLMPLVQQGRVFEAQNGVIAYISDDPNYIPIRIESELWLGSFKFDLVEYSGLKNSLAFVKDD